MDDMRLKRKLIEAGQLKTWSRHGHLSQAENLRLIKWLLRIGLRLTGLRARGQRNALNPVIRNLCLEFDDLPEAFHGFTILHLSDLHVDGFAGLAENIADKLQDVEADLCVLTGDYRFLMNGSCRDVYPAMSHIVASIRARHGLVGVLGNHDAAEMVPEFESMGVRMLLNESLEVRQGEHSIWLAGLDDPHYYGCADLPKALLNVPEHAFKMLLVHTPEMLEAAHQNGIRLYLCGHTHGGQICLPLFGPVVTHIKGSREYASGAWQYESVKGYTSPGVGCSGVIARFLCPPELVRIELRRTGLKQSQQISNVNRIRCSTAASINNGAC